MKTFTAKVVNPKGEKRFIPNATIYKGKVVQISEKGVGEARIEGGMNAYGEGETWEVYEKYEQYYKAFINSTLIEENGLTKDEVVRLLNEDQSNAFTDSRIFNCLFVMGENPNGYMVYDNDVEKEEERKRKIEERKQQLNEEAEKRGFRFEHEKTTKSQDEDGTINCYHYKITHIETERVFKYTDRNLFDFGRVVNTVYPVDGGMAINIESFIKNNPFSFSGLSSKEYHEKKDSDPNYDHSKSDCANEYRANHPTTSGWGWDRYWIAKDSEDKREWVPMDEIDVAAYNLAVDFGMASNQIKM